MAAISKIIGNPDDVSELIEVWLKSRQCYVNMLLCHNFKFSNKPTLALSLVLAYFFGIPSPKLPRDQIENRLYGITNKSRNTLF